MTTRIRSTGAEILPLPETATHEELSEARRRGLNSEANRMREAIAERIERHREEDAISSHDVAVEQFDYAYKDVTSNPHLLKEVVREREALINEAAMKRETVDWHNAYRKIGETVRKKAGLPSGEKIEREEVLSDMRKARGQV